MKVYVVTTGSYSDYTIEKIFSRKELAQEYVKWSKDCSRVEEHEVDNTAEFLFNRNN